MYDVSNMVVFVVLLIIRVPRHDLGHRVSVMGHVGNSYITIKRKQLANTCITQYQTNSKYVAVICNHMCSSVSALR